MTDDKRTQAPVSLIDNPMASDVYADATLGYHLRDGMVKITLGSVRANHTTTPWQINNVVVGRLVMTVPAAKALAVGLFDFLKSQGVDFSEVGRAKGARPN